MTTSTNTAVRGVDPARHRLEAAAWGALGLGALAWVRALSGAYLLDLRVYRAGGAALLAQAGIYQPHFDPSDPHTRLHFTYPPFAAALFAPFAVLPWPVVVAALTVAGLAAFALTVRLVLPAADRCWAPLAVLAATVLGPVGSPQGTLVMGQVNLLLMALVAADLLAGDRRHRGALIGVAAGVKLTPAIFLVYLALTGRRRAALTGAGAFAVTVLIGFVLAPGDSLLFWTRLWWDPAHVGNVAYAANQSIAGALARQGLAAPWLAPLVGCWGLAVARRAHRAGDERWAVLVTALTGLLISPISWLHHWVWAVPIALVLAYRCWPVAALWLLPFAVQPMWQPRSWLGADSVTLAGLALLAAAPLLVRHRQLTAVREWRS